jgi:D-alanyl-D-alanine carboxypeptidase/D-alanyl-D-alanine-endopeptidase (penicillin-binding protein 4)
VTVARAGGLTALAGALLAGSLSVSPPSGASGTVSPDGTTGKAPTSTVPRVTAAALPGLNADRPLPDRAALAARLAGPLAQPILGNPAGIVLDALTGEILFDQRAETPTAPASTLKMAVATAALRTLSPTTRLTTRVVYLPPASGPTAGTRSGGTLWLVGAGDPTLTAATGPTDYPASVSARLSDLAAQVRAAGITGVGRVIGDGTLFSGPGTAPGWSDSYVTEGDVTPVSALEVDGGRPRPGALGARAGQPDAAAAAEFATALRAVGVSVGSTGTGAADPAATPVATADSPPVPVLVEEMLTNSDNDIAESLGRLVARARGLPPSFAGAAAADVQALQQLGLDVTQVRLSDVSGLSVGDQIPPRTLVTILRTATLPGHPELRTLLTGLPVAGFSGTLGDRYNGADTAGAAGDVRAKTGSLRTVTSLAGEVVDADGRLLLFGFFAPVDESSAAKSALDRVAAALAGCGCTPTGRATATAGGGTGPSAAATDQSVAAGPTHGS